LNKRRFVSKTLRTHYIWFFLFRLLKAFRLGESEQPSFKIIHTEPGVSDVDNLCLYSSFSKSETVDEYVFDILNELNLNGFKISFCTTSSKIDEISLERLRKLCFQVIKRENITGDFGSWHTQLKIHKGSSLNYTNLLLMNDSLVLAKNKSIKKVIDDINACESGFVGLTDCFLRKWHLQSFFLYFRPVVHKSKEWNLFWEEFIYYKYKFQVINGYEYGLSNALADYRPTALFSVAKMKNIQKRITNLSAVVDLWEELVCRYDFPFVKKSILEREKKASSYASFN
jgi:hypothetical protein